MPKCRHPQSACAQRARTAQAPRVLGDKDGELGPPEGPPRAPRRCWGLNRRGLGRVFSPGSMRTDVRCDTEPMACGAPTGGGQTGGVPAAGETQVTAAPALGHEA